MSPDSRRWPNVQAWSGLSPASAVTTISAGPAGMSGGTSTTKRRSSGIVVLIDTVFTRFPSCPLDRNTNASRAASHHLEQIVGDFQGDRLAYDIPLPLRPSLPQAAWKSSIEYKFGRANQPSRALKPSYGGTVSGVGGDVKLELQAPWGPTRRGVRSRMGSGHRNGVRGLTPSKVAFARSYRAAALNSSSSFNDASWTPAPVSSISNRSNSFPRCS